MAETNQFLPCLDTMEIFEGTVMGWIGDFLLYRCTVQSTSLKNNSAFDKYLPVEYSILNVIFKNNLIDATMKELNVKM